MKGFREVLWSDLDFTKFTLAAGQRMGKTRPAMGSPLRGLVRVRAVKGRKEGSGYVKRRYLGG